ncbi:hypothetical protein MMC22_007468 [Lobaria immixta]|nr:hypothetical protein [Lobaria immixta]
MSATLSPTGRLLRTSRLFSLPPPLPRPGAKLAMSRPESDTATLPYPTHAAIETTRSSLKRGDWGLKRTLPRRLAKLSSTPLIRINDIDSIDHITEFESAADYTITLRKWQEMNVPISVALPPRATIDEARSFHPSESVFETSFDNTDPGNGETKSARWKFKGPWLASKSEGEFQQYVQKDVRRQKFAFREFLLSELRARMVEDQKRIALDSGQDFEPRWKPVAARDLNAFIRQLRQDRNSLHHLIEKFLDLPNYNVLSGQISTKADLTSTTKTKEHVFMEAGPPGTHPAAGLSYLRTASHVHNHPVLGPQQDEPPVQGRVLRPRLPRAKDMRAFVGVAGVVTEDDRPSLNKQTVPYGVAEFDPDAPGGTKNFFHPEHASIDSQGRVMLLVKHAKSDALTIYKGITPQDEEKFDASIISGGDRQFPSSSSSLFAAPRETSAQGYGLEGTDHESRSGGTKPIADVSHNQLLDLLGAQSQGKETTDKN